MDTGDRNHHHRPVVRHRGKQGPVIDWANGVPVAAWEQHVFDGERRAIITQRVVAEREALGLGPVMVTVEPALTRAT